MPFISLRNFLQFLIFCEFLSWMIFNLVNFVYVLRCLNVPTIYSINIVNYINSFLYVKPNSDSWGNVFNSQFAPFSLPSSSLVHGQTKLCSPALALEKALCNWVVTLSSPAHRNTLLHDVEVWWKRVGGWMRLMLWLRLLRIQTSHARSHVLMWRSFQVQLVSMEKPSSSCSSARNTSHRHFFL